jgi:hypothetical protein
MKTYKVLWWVCASVLVFLAAQAEEFQAPTAVDLKASYCSAVDKNNYALLTAPLPNAQGNAALEHAMKLRDEEAQKVARDIARLNAYMTARLMYLDPVPLQIAYSRGENDFKQLMDYASSSEVQSATIACLKKKIDECAHLRAEKQKQCRDTAVDQCTNVPPPPAIADIRASVKTCRDLSWLPF